MLSFKKRTDLRADLYNRLCQCVADHCMENGVQYSDKVADVIRSKVESKVLQPAWEIMLAVGEEQEKLEIKSGNASKWNTVENGN